MRGSCALILAAAVLLVSSTAGEASASDEADVKAFIANWVGDFDKGDIKAFAAGCAPHAAAIDAFPPYAWRSCDDWLAAYAANSRRIQLTNARLSIGDAVYADAGRDHACLVYPAVFTDEEKGAPATYGGTWTITLQKDPGSLARHRNVLELGRRLHRPQRLLKARATRPRRRPDPALRANRSFPEAETRRLDTRLSGGLANRLVRCKTVFRM